MLNNATSRGDFHWYFLFGSYIRVIFLFKDCDVGRDGQTDFSDDSFGWRANAAPDTRKDCVDAITFNMQPRWQWQYVPFANGQTNIHRKTPISSAWKHLSVRTTMTSIDDGSCESSSLTVVLMCKGRGSDSFRPNRDESQWWSRRDALVRCVASFLFSGTGWNKTLICIFGDDTIWPSWPWRSIRTTTRWWFPPNNPSCPSFNRRHFASLLLKTIV